MLLLMLLHTQIYNLPPNWFIEKFLQSTMWRFINFDFKNRTGQRTKKKAGSLFNPILDRFFSILTNFLPIFSILTKPVLGLISGSTN